jgi:hypothetical protein
MPNLQNGKPGYLSFPGTSLKLYGKGGPTSM